MRMSYDSIFNKKEYYKDSNILQKNTNINIKKQIEILNICNKDNINGIITNNSNNNDDIVVDNGLFDNRLTTYEDYLNVFNEAIMECYYMMLSIYGFQFQEFVKNALKPD